MTLLAFLIGALAGAVLAATYIRQPELRNATDVERALAETQRQLALTQAEKRSAEWRALHYAGEYRAAVEVQKKLAKRYCLALLKAEKTRVADSLEPLQ